MFLPEKTDPFADDASLQPAERAARSFARMIRMYYDGGGRVNFSSAEFDDEAIRGGIKLLESIGLNVDVLQARPRRVSRNLDACALVTKIAPQTERERFAPGFDMTAVATS